MSTSNVLPAQKQKYKWGGGGVEMTIYIKHHLWGKEKQNIHTNFEHCWETFVLYVAVFGESALKRTRLCSTQYTYILENGKTKKQNLHENLEVWME